MRTKGLLYGLRVRGMSFIKELFLPKYVREYIRREHFG